MKLSTVTVLITEYCMFNVNISGYAILLMYENFIDVGIAVTHCTQHTYSMFISILCAPLECIPAKIETPYTVRSATTWSHKLPVHAVPW
jgi:hypothetical protein